MYIQFQNCVVLDSNEIIAINYYDKDDKRIKQIDLKKVHKGIKFHTQYEYEYNENDSQKGASKLITEKIECLIK